jgi:hypothetical protein
LAEQYGENNIYEQLKPGLAALRNSPCSIKDNIAKQKIEGALIPYTTFNDLDEIKEKIDELLKNQEALAESMSRTIELFNTALIKEKDESKILKVHSYKILFKKIFGGSK